MKQILYKTIAMATMFAVVVNMNAKSWRVNSNTTRGVNFADINAAMSSVEVQDGDTLYLDPGCNLTSNQYVTKCVTVIGNGFFHDKQQPYGFATISGETHLQAAGCKIEGVIMTHYCYVAADNVTIERCYLTGSWGIRTSGNNCKYATIRNCYFNNYYGCIRGTGKTSMESAYWIIQNNMINSINFDYNNATVSNLCSATISNNFIRRYYNSNYNYGLSDLYNCTIINNIILTGNKDNILFNCSDCVNNHNVLSCTEGTYPNNICLNSIELTTIFTMTGDNDLQFQLCEGSPAKGYATDGGDCGPYGSGYTYVPGGLPYGKPYYTEATIGSVAHDGKVNVTLKISVQDE